MSRRTAALPLGLLAALALFLSACGAGTPTSAPGATATTVPVTQAPPTQAPVTQAPPTSGPSADALASFHGATDLEALLPDSAGGKVITKASVTGAQFMTMGGGTEIQKALTALNKQPSDMKVAFGGSGSLTVFAFQVNGIPGSQLLSAIFAAQTGTATVTDTTLGGKSVKKVVTTGGTTTSYIYSSQDVVFAVTAAADVTSAVLDEVFQQLP